jgi:hypothetical protein
MPTGGMSTSRTGQIDAQREWYKYLPLGRAVMMNHHSNGGFRPSMGPITLPSSLNTPAFDVGGIGVAVVVHLPLPGPVLHRRRRRYDLAYRGDGVFIYRFLGRWPI